MRWVPRPPTSAPTAAGRVHSPRVSAHPSIAPRPPCTLAWRARRLAVRVCTRRRARAATQILWPPPARRQAGRASMPASTRLAQRTLHGVSPAAAARTAAAPRLHPHAAPSAAGAHTGRGGTRGRGKRDAKSSCDQPCSRDSTGVDHSASMAESAAAVEDASAASVARKDVRAAEEGPAAGRLEGVAVFAPSDFASSSSAAARMRPAAELLKGRPPTRRPTQRRRGRESRGGSCTRLHLRRRRPLAPCRAMGPAWGGPLPRSAQAVAGGRRGGHSSSSSSAGSRRRCRGRSSPAAAAAAAAAVDRARAAACEHEWECAAAAAAAREAGRWDVAAAAAALPAVGVAQRCAERRRIISRRQGGMGGRNPCVGERRAQRSALCHTDTPPTHTCKRARRLLRREKRTSVLGWRGGGGGGGALVRVQASCWRPHVCGAPWQLPLPSLTPPLSVPLRPPSHAQRRSITSGS